MKYSLKIVYKYDRNLKIRNGRQFEDLCLIIFRSMLMLKRAIVLFLFRVSHCEKLWCASSLDGLVITSQMQ